MEIPAIIYIPYRRTRLTRAARCPRRFTFRKHISRKPSQPKISRRKVPSHDRASVALRPWAAHSEPSCRPSPSRARHRSSCVQASSHATRCGTSPSSTPRPWQTSPADPPRRTRAVGATSPQTSARYSPSTVAMQSTFASGSTRSIRGNWLGQRFWWRRMGRILCGRIGVTWNSLLNLWMERGL